MSVHRGIFGLDSVIFLCVQYGFKKLFHIDNLKLCFECLFFQVIWKISTCSGSQYFTFITSRRSLVLQLRSAASLLASSDKVVTMVLFFPFLSSVNFASLLLYPFTILPLFWGFYLFFEIGVQRSHILINTSIIFISLVASFLDAYVLPLVGHVSLLLYFRVLPGPWPGLPGQSLNFEGSVLGEPAVPWHVVLGRSRSSVIRLCLISALRA